LLLLLGGERLKQRCGGCKVLRSNGNLGHLELGGYGTLYLCLYELRSGDQPDTGTTLDPHLSIRVQTGAPRAAPTPAEEHAKRIGIAVRIAVPIFYAGMDDVELEGEDVLEDVCARCGWGDGAERAE
jgi:hypothetical protein